MLVILFGAGRTDPLYNVMMSDRKVTIGLIQMTCSHSKKDNLDKATAMIRTSARQGAQIICLQELFASLYFCQEENYDSFAHAEPVPGPSVNHIQKLAAELNVAIIASLFEKRAKGVYHNTVAVIDAGGALLGRYRKHHIPDDPGYYEKFYFTPGDSGYKAFDTKFARIGTLVCWDQWYPEAARITSLMGAEILFYPTAIGWNLSQDLETNNLQYQAWQIIQRAHAIANGIYIVAVNRTGTEDKIRFWGGSFISGPFGELLFQAPNDQEVIHVQELDLHRIDEIRVHWPFLRDRRIDSYKPVLRRF